MKKLSFTKLTALLLFLIFALVSCTPNNAVSSDTSSADDTSEKRFFNSNNDGWCVDPGVYRNIYTGAPDIPPVGSLQLTPLAAYLANTAEDGEEMYFLVGNGFKKFIENFEGMDERGFHVVRLQRQDRRGISFFL